jgi:hypothetical protein
MSQKSIYRHLDKMNLIDRDAYFKKDKKLMERMKRNKELRDKLKPIQ